MRVFAAGSPAIRTVLGDALRGAAALPKLWKPRQLVPVVLILMLIAATLAIPTDSDATEGPDPSTAARTAAILGGIPTVEATLIAATDTSVFEPPGPDPTGITYIDGSDSLLVSDSEVDEVGIFENVNLYTMTRAGALIQTGVTLPNSKEPAGVAYDQAIDRLYVADDSSRRILILESGTDAKFGTLDDDLIGTLDTACFGSADPEGITVDPASGDLYIMDGAGDRVYRVSVGANGVFDGIDDIISSFDVAAFGASGPEGIAYNGESGTILIVDSGIVFEISRSGVLQRLITLDQATTRRRPSGLVLAPATGGSGWNMFIVDRGVDNNVDPDENDGQMFEMAVDFGAPGSPPEVPNPGAPIPACGFGGSFLDDDLNTHEPSIEAIAAFGITLGCEPTGVVYCPSQSVSRGQMASFLDRALSLPAVSIDYFVDDDGNTHEGSINRVAGAGITLGCDATATVFCPNASVTRAQMASFLKRALVLPAAMADYFVDDEGNTHEDNINRVAEAEITLGCDATGVIYCPDDSVTRAQMASFLGRGLDLLLRTPPVRPMTTIGPALDAESALQACGDPLNCSASRSIAAGIEFYIEDGWHLAGWSSTSAVERDSFLDLTTTADIRVNGGDLLSTAEKISVDGSDVAHKVYSFQFPDDMSGTHSVVIEWFDLGVLVSRVMLTVTVGP